MQNAYEYEGKLYLIQQLLFLKFRVRGVDGLRVVDASVLPRLPSGPPNSVLVAVAERAADFIINKY